jgi:hypothetical protein
MINRTELVQTIANLVKNGINMDGYNLFECNLFMKELKSIFFDPLLSIELEKTTIQCIPITDEGWLDAVFEVVKFMHVRAAKKREEERENLRKEAEANKEFDWI